MSSDPSLVPPFTRLAGSQSSARQSRPVLACLPVRPRHSLRPLSGFVPVLSSYILLDSTSAGSIVLPPLVDRLSVSILEPELITISTGIVVLGVHPLQSSSGEYCARVIVVSILPPPPDLYK